MNKLERLQEESVELMMRRYEDEPSHARQVTRLALIIFDQTKESLHNYGKQEKNYLKFAGFLHDIGYHIAAEKHNKHAYKMIMNSKMDGFTPDELEIIANIARYHRGKPPKNKHDNFKTLQDKKTRDLVKCLSSFLRIADGLDRSHTDAINDIKVLVYKDMGRAVFVLYPRTASCAMEIYGAEKKKDLFEDFFNLDIDFQIKQM